jgi:hypothetical protein
MQPLFNPRENDWNEHFEWDGPRLRGKTPIGRATIDVLAINANDRVAFRRELIQEGLRLSQLSSLRQHSKYFRVSFCGARAYPFAPRWRS